MGEVILYTYDPRIAQQIILYPRFIYTLRLHILMDIASKLKKGDKQRFLNDNILIVNIISDWNSLTH